MPPTPRRRADARRAGLHAASPWLTGAAAAVGTLVAVAGLAVAIVDRWTAAIASACRNPASGSSPLPSLSSITALASPIVAVLALTAVIAIIAHLGQTRALWLPRRRIRGAPLPPRDRGWQMARELAAPSLIGAATVGWLWFSAPQIAALFEQPLAAGPLIASAAATLVATWLGLAIGDSVARHLALAGALRMTRAEHREELRRSAADPRWRKLRARLSAPRDVVASASVVIVDDNLATACAIGWHPRRQPIPTRIAVGRGAAATAVISLARRFAVPIHRDGELATALGDSEGAVPEALWPRLAEIVSATSGSRPR